MYVSVPKNYSGITFAAENGARGDLPSSPTLPLPMPPGVPTRPLTPPPTPEPPAPCPTPEEKKSPPAGKDCQKQDKNPLTCLLTALSERGKSGIDTEDFLLIGLIALLLGKEGHEALVLALALLLLF